MSPAQNSQASHNSSCGLPIESPPALTPQPRPITQLGPITAISPASSLASDLYTDIVFVSSDNVAFYASSSAILARSQNRWGSLVAVGSQGIIPATTPITAIRLSESSDILNVVFHTLHDKPCAHLSPSSDTLVSAIDALAKYGLPLRTCTAPGTLLYTLLLDHGRLSPLRFFAAAAQYGLDALAVPLSALLLTHTIADIPDECVRRMGPLYLKRLVLLQMHRADMLKHIVPPPAAGHAPTPACNRSTQDQVAHAWSCAAATLALEAAPEVTESTLTARFRDVCRSVACPMCRTALDARVRDMVASWACVKSTI